MDTEYVLIKRMRRGDDVAFDAFVHKYYKDILRYCTYHCFDAEEAKDLTQETFLRYLEHPQYHNIDKTLQLLYTIAGNLCADEFRKRPSSEISEDTVSDENLEENVLTNLSLHQALNRLQDEEREIILLRYVNDVPINVISGIYNISRFAVNRKIKKILAALHNELGKEELQ